LSTTRAEREERNKREKKRGRGGEWKYNSPALSKYCVTKAKKEN
jgi:hypothetical protein